MINSQSALPLIWNYQMKESVENKGEGRTDLFCPIAYEPHTHMQHTHTHIDTGTNICARTRAHKHTHIHITHLCSMKCSCNEWLEWKPFQKTARFERSHDGRQVWKCWHHFDIMLSAPLYYVRNFHIRIIAACCMSRFVPDCFMLFKWYVENYFLNTKAQFDIVK